MKPIYHIAVTAAMFCCCLAMFWKYNTLMNNSKEYAATAYQIGKQNVIIVYSEHVLEVQNGGVRFELKEIYRRIDSMEKANPEVYGTLTKDYSEPR